MPIFAQHSRMGSENPPLRSGFFIRLPSASLGEGSARRRQLEYKVESHRYIPCFAGEAAKPKVKARRLACQPEQCRGAGVVDAGVLIGRCGIAASRQCKVRCLRRYGMAGMRRRRKAAVYGNDGDGCIAGTGAAIYGKWFKWRPLSRVAHCRWPK